MESIAAIIARIDQQLTQQINLIIHHHDFQQLEGAWRGLHYLVQQTGSDEMLKVRVMNISKAEVRHKLMCDESTDWEDSLLFEMYDVQYEQVGGEPFGCIVADYYFDHSTPDVDWLRQMAKVSAAAQCPFLAGASANVMQLASWQDLPAAKDLRAVCDGPEYSSWHTLRESDEARYIGLVLPRFLARRPYGATGMPVEEFAFEEDSSARDSTQFTWANSAYLMAANITRAFKTYGWCSRIWGLESGGRVERLPAHAFETGTDGVELRPTEVSIGHWQSHELDGYGFMQFLPQKDSESGAFFHARALHQPQVHDDAAVTANAALYGRLPYVFGCCRFAQYLRCVVRDGPQSFRERDDVQAALQRWIAEYVAPPNASEATKAAKPLAAADIRLHNVGDDSGYWWAEMFLQPLYQLDGLCAPLRLVARLPTCAHDYCGENRDRTRTFESEPHSKREKHSANDHLA